MAYEHPPSYDQAISEQPPPPNVALPSAPVESMHMSIPNQTVAGVPHLTFVDFLPRCLHAGRRTTKVSPGFESFRSTMLYANGWLASHPDCRVVSIEEIDRPTDWNGTYEIDNAIELTTAGDNNLLVRGLRIWVRPRFMSDTNPPQQLDYFNYLPTKDPGGDVGPRGSIGVHVMGVMASASFGSSRTGRGEYFNLDNTLQMLNSVFPTNPIPGQIISLRTVQLPLGDIDRLSMVDVSENMADQALLNNAGTGNTYFNFIRVYYARGPPPVDRLEVGMVDFVPAMTAGTKTSKDTPKFENFSVLTTKAAAWVQERHGRDLFVTNYQTVTATRDMTYNMTSASIDTRKSCLHLTDGPNHRRLHVKFLRVNYLWPVQIPGPQLLLSTRTVPPILYKLKRAETIGMTVEKINYWLRASGACVIGVETVDEPYHEHTGRCEMNESSFITTRTGRYTLSVIRLYISGPFEDIDLTNTLLNMKYNTGSSSRSSKSCVII